MNQKKELFSSLRDRNDFYIALFVILVFGGFIAFIMVREDAPKNPISQHFEEASISESNQDHKELLKTPPSTSDVVMGAPIIKAQSFQESLVLKEDKKEMLSLSSMAASSVLEPVDDQDSEWSDEKQDAERLVVMEDSTKEASKKVGVIAEVASIANFDSLGYKAKPVVVNRIDRIVSNTDSTSTIEQPSEKNKNGILVTNNTVVTANCTLVIGVFNEVKNVDRSIDKLIKYGFKPHSGIMKNGTHFAGVPVDCKNKTAIKNLMRSIQDSLDIRSWVRKN